MCAYNIKDIIYDQADGSIGIVESIYLKDDKHFIKVKWHLSNYLNEQNITSETEDSLCNLEYVHFPLNLIS